MARLDYATGYGSRVHILQTDSRDALCGTHTHQDWSEPEEPKPADICKRCLSAAENLGMIDYVVCPQCQGTGKVTQEAGAV